MSAPQSRTITVIVTGSAGGLGKATATAFLEAGANVTICDINQDRLSEAKSELSSKYADKLLVQEANTTSEDDVEKLVKDTVAKFGRLDMLINNAAVMDVFDTADTCSREVWDRVISINLTGPFVTTKFAIKAMLEQSPSGGTIINMGSNASVNGGSAGVAYTASKHGVLGLTRNTAAFYDEKGITCTMLQLGGLSQTNITDAFAKGLNMDNMQTMQKLIPGFKPGENDTRIEDVAKFCVFLGDRNIAKSLNGASVPFNKNWPAGF
jgi:NAD(P)-dependent dehydrogenase (short-subunit alcohol dehydrogenase family)